MLSSPAIIFSGTLYRTNKIVASLGIFLTIAFLIISFLGNESRKKYVLLICIYASTLLASGADEQGVIFILLIALILIYIYCFFQRKFLYELFAIILGLITYISYIKFIGVWLFKSISGIDPVITGIQNLEILNFSNYVQSLALLARYFISIFGNIYYFGLVGIVGYLLLFIIYVYFIIRGNGFINLIKCLIIILLSLLYISIVIHLMTLKHGAIFWEDIITYYPLPIIFLIFSIFLISLHYSAVKNKIKISFLNLILFLLIIFNLTSLNHYIDIFRSGHLKNFRAAHLITNAVYSDPEQSLKILNSLKLNEVVTGTRPDMNYAEKGVHILRMNLNEVN